MNGFWQKCFMDLQTQSVLWTDPNSNDFAASRGSN